MRQSISYAFFSLCLMEQLQLSSSSNSSSDGDGNLCGMYLAPSTISGAGMGVFAGHTDTLKGDYLLADDGDLIVPVYDLDKHIGNKNYDFLWEEYTWKAKSFIGMSEEVEDVENVKACSTGLGAAINCILPMVNVVDDYDNRQVGLSGISVDTDGKNYTITGPLLSSSLSSPGVGAFTPYYNRRWKAKMDIPAGMELYGNYGQGYFKSRAVYDKVPLRDDYKKINKLLKKFQSITAGSNQVTEQQKTDLLIYLQTLSSVWEESRTMYAIPLTDPPGDFGVIDWLLQREGGSGMIHYNISIRDLDWLQEHGRCMDNIRDGISRIPHAGRGAFARRAIPEGTVVAPAPLIQIPDRRILTIYDEKRMTKKKKEFVVADHDKPIHHQLLLNYCFGHRESTLLLCPYGLMTSHINHDAINPNTKIVWATNDQMGHPEWRKKSIEQWGRKDYSGLSFNFVALRNIKEDEEVTIDYGSEWEETWQKHLKLYYENDERNENATHDTIDRIDKEIIDKHHVPAYELNKLIDLKLSTMEEGDYETEGVRLFCRKTYLERSGAGTSVLDDKDDKDVTIITLITRKTRRIKLRRTKYSDWNNNEVFPCRIRNRYRSTNTRDESEINDNLDFRYVVELFERTDKISKLDYSDSKENDKISNTTNRTKDYVWGIMFDVPRDAFYFEDRKNHRHHHQIWSFRHDMRIPDNIFPGIWRNSK